MAQKPNQGKPPALLAKQQGGAVAPWQEQLANEAAAVAKTEVTGTKTLSFRNGILSYDGTPIQGNVTSLVVLDWAFLHTWYPEAFDPNKSVSPSCWAVGRVENELAPPDDVEDKQGDADGLCLNCELNEWGSDPDGGKGKACKNLRRLIVMSAEVLKAGPKGISAAEVVTAQLPVTSVKNWSQFVVQIAHVVKRPPYGVISEISVVPDPRTQFQVKWAFVDTVPDEYIPAIMEKRTALGDAVLSPFPPNQKDEPASAKGKPASKQAAKPRRF